MPLLSARGGRFEVITDHKPLIGIMNKLINEIHNVRLSKFRQQLSPYNIEMSWNAGKVHFAADALSRYPIFAAQEEDDENSIMLRQIRACEPTDTRVGQLATAAAEDDQYQQMVQALENDHFNLSQNPSHPAWSLKSNWDSLSTVHLPEGTLIAMGDRIFVPQTERERVLVELHKTHQGSVKTKLAAKESYFWSGMNNEISNILENCETCQTFCPSQKHDSQQNFVTHLTRPMQLLSVDIFHYSSNTYFLLVDGFS
jgi:hypothetical protein